MNISCTKIDCICVFSLILNSSENLSLKKNLQTTYYRKRQVTYMKKPLAKTFQFTFHNLYRLSELLTNTGFEDYLQPKTK